VRPSKRERLRATAVNWKKARRVAAGYTLGVGNVIDARVESPSRVAEEAARVVFAGGTIVFPTDTVYGIGCDPYNARAVASIFSSKRRPGTKALTLHLATVAEFLEYAKSNPTALLAAKRLMPGPVTIIVRRPAFIGEDVTAGLPTLGFRVPDDPLCSAILDRCGPLAATSANISGERAYRGEGDIEALPDTELVIQNGPTRYGAESTVLDCSGTHPVLLREGVVKMERLSEVLSAVGPVMRPETKMHTT